MNTFNANFYITAATVIPVLYLALTLQGNTYRDLMARWRETNRVSPFTLRAQARVVLVALIAISGAIAILQGVLGEYSALQALANEHAGDQTESNVFGACLLLLVMVAVGPAWWFLEAFFGSLADDFRSAVDGKLGRIFPELKKHFPPAVPARDDQSKHEEPTPESN